MGALRQLRAVQTAYPDGPVIEQPYKRKLEPGQWTSLAIDAWNSVQTAISARWALEENIRGWRAVYGLQVEEKNDPWVGCSNIVVPLAPAKLDTLWAQIVSQVFVPEFYIVNGPPGDKAAQEVAYEVQRFYNGELKRERPEMDSWYQEHLKWLFEGLLDGTGVMEMMWRYRERKTRYGIEETDIDPEDGLPRFDENGEPKKKRKRIDRTVVDYNDVLLRARKLKDFVLIPAFAMDVHSAAAVAVADWLYESDLMAMVEDDLLEAEWVERALSYVPAGTTDVQSDRQGVYDKAADWQVDPGQTQGPLASEFFKNRGPLKVWRIHTSQYDLDGDGWPEENVLWVHDVSNFLLGWCPDEYIAPTRPFRLFSPFPRDDQAYGYSLLERLAPLQAEASTLRNQRNDMVDLATSPPLAVNETVEQNNKDMAWGPGKRWSVRGKANEAVSQIPMAFPPQQAYQEEAQINAYADQISGLAAPMEGASTSSRRTAAEIKQRAQGTNVRASLVAMLFRFASRSVIQFVHRLKQQYPPNPDTPYALSPDILKMEFMIDVAGTNDPLNANENVQEALGLYNLFMKDPDIAQNAVARYHLKKWVFESMHTRDMEAIIGTEDEAKQRQQMEEQQRQMQMQMQQMAMAQAAQGGKPGVPAKPAQNGHPPAVQSPPRMGPA